MESTGRLSDRESKAVESQEFAVERGPEWLFIRLPESGGRETVSVVSGLLETTMIKRVVLELDRVGRVDGTLAQAISSLGRHVEKVGGVIRICGLSESDLAEVRRAPGASRIPHYTCRAEAVRASRDPALASPGSSPSQSGVATDVRSDLPEE